MLHYIKQTFRYTKRHGLKKTIRKIIEVVKKRTNEKKGFVYKLEAHEKTRQEHFEFDKKIMFSILVPLYNTPKKFLTDMIESVQNQTYSDWELCLADGSDSKHAYVGEICRKYQKKDSRILYRKLETNLGISGNTNECIKMSSGDYMALLDHDDLLHQAALFECMMAICDNDADFIYSDQCKIHQHPKNAYDMFYKADYSPDMLRSMNYIIHFTVFQRALLDDVGMFRSEFDGSQDYDLILRLTEKAEKIFHIPKILYFWRANPNSTALDPYAKMYAYDAAKLAISEHLKRLNLEGEVLDTDFLGFYRIKYKLIGEPLVSIIIQDTGDTDSIGACLNSILDKTTYKNYEIIIVGSSNSQRKKSFYANDSLKENQKIKLISYEDDLNYSQINNAALQHTIGEHVVFLDSNVRIASPCWLEEMLMYSQRSDVGAVGAMIYYPNETIRDAGILLKPDGVERHSHQGSHRGDYGYFGRLVVAQNVRAVTSDCMMVSTITLQKTGGFDPRFSEVFSDVDLCMRIQERGDLIVWTPHAQACYYKPDDKKSDDIAERQKLLESEAAIFKNLWGEKLQSDGSYY